MALWCWLALVLDKLEFKCCQDFRFRGMVKTALTHPVKDSTFWKIFRDAVGFGVAGIPDEHGKDFAAVFIADDAGSRRLD